MRHKLTVSEVGVSHGSICLLRCHLLVDQAEYGRSFVSAAEVLSSECFISTRDPLEGMEVTGNVSALKIAEAFVSNIQW